MNEDGALEDKVKALRYELKLAANALGWCAKQFEDRGLNGPSLYSHNQKQRAEECAEWGLEEAPPR